MNCQELENLISAYLEDELPADLQRQVEDHLQECPECRQLRERVECLLQELPELEEEVPFFLKNRLYSIPACEEEEVRGRIVYLSPKWVAAAVGTILLCLNLFYFTNIVPPANRGLHRVTAGIEKLVGQMGGFFEKVKESKDFLLFTFFNKKSLDVDDENAPSKKKADNPINSTTSSKGGKNG